MARSLAKKVKFTNVLDRPEQRSVVSSIVVERYPGHWVFNIWNRGSHAGQLTVDQKDGPIYLDMLMPQADRASEEELEA